MLVSLLLRVKRSIGHHLAFWQILTIDQFFMFFWNFYRSNNESANTEKNLVAAPKTNTRLLVTKLNLNLFKLEQAKPF